MRILHSSQSHQIIRSPFTVKRQRKPNTDHGYPCTRCFWARLTVGTITNNVGYLTISPSYHLTISLTHFLPLIIYNAMTIQLCIQLGSVWFLSQNPRCHDQTISLALFYSILITFSMCISHSHTYVHIASGYESSLLSTNPTITSPTTAIHTLAVQSQHLYLILLSFYCLWSLQGICSAQFIIFHWVAYHWGAYHNTPFSRIP